MKTDNVYFINPYQLRIGLYVHLDLGWMDHPFTFSNFKIRNEGQIAQIKALGLKQLRYDPLRSDCEPEPPKPMAQQMQAAPTAMATTTEALTTTESEQSFETQRLEELRQAVHECERKFVHAVTEVTRIEREIHIAPPKTMAEAHVLVDSMVESLLTESDVVLHAMNDRRGMAEQYSHGLNVTVLSLILAKSMDMTEAEVKHLAMGALFHDIGKSQIPDRITRKTDPLTKSELTLLQQHCQFGATFAENFKLDPHVKLLIQQHHECMDGSGFPDRLKGEQIDCLSRIVAIVNTYDNLCNPMNLATAMTPYEALANMFSRQRTKFDPNILKLLIKSLGVYPPGSVVRLSSGDHGMVMSVNPSKPLRPCVMLHLPDVPRKTPMLIDLGDEAALSITQCLRPSQLPKEALEYLSPGRRISYYFDKEKAAHSAEAPPAA